LSTACNADSKKGSDKVFEQGLQKNLGKRKTEASLGFLEEN